MQFWHIAITAPLASHGDARVTLLDKLPGRPAAVHRRRRGDPPATQWIIIQPSRTASTAQLAARRSAFEPRRNGAQGRNRTNDTQNLNAHTAAITHCFVGEKSTSAILC
ncbi:MAG: hypothetical protein WCO86_05005 [Planctomycetota bacterium]